MEIVVRVCDPLFRGAVEAARTTDPHALVTKAASSYYEFRTIRMRAGGPELVLAERSLQGPPL